jgi:hypothetical protein
LCQSVQNDGFHIRGGIRTRDLLLRRQTRYPLRYTDSAVIFGSEWGSNHFFG